MQPDTIKRALQNGLSLTEKSIFLHFRTETGKVKEIAKDEDI